MSSWSRGSIFGFVFDDASRWTGGGGIIFSKPRFFSPVYNGSLPRGVSVLWKGGEKHGGERARGMINETWPGKICSTKLAISSSRLSSRLFGAVENQPRTDGIMQRMPTKYVLYASFVRAVHEYFAEYQASYEFSQHSFFFFIMLYCANGYPASRETGLF